jgi:hypothetical protein
MMIDAVEIINRFTEYSPSKGEEPLPLPIPGHWFRKICALADRIAAAENERDALRERCAELELRLDIGTGNLYDVAVEMNEKLQEENTRLRDALRLAVKQRDVMRETVLGFSNPRNWRKTQTFYMWDLGVSPIEIAEDALGKMGGE